MQARIKVIGSATSALLASGHSE